MEIREQHNLARLFVESFVLVNRCGGALVVWLLFAVVILACQGMLHFIGVPSILVKYFILFPATYQTVVLLRILGAKAENTGESVSNSFSASVFPSIYFLVYNIIILSLTGTAMFVAVRLLRMLPFTESLQTTVAAFISNTATASSWLSVAAFVIGAALPLLLFARLIYAHAAIALRDQGPLEAIAYSWQLTSGKHYFTALGTGLISTLLLPAYFASVLYVMYTVIPLYFADSFNLAALSPVWWGVFIVLGLIYLLLMLVIPAFVILVFLNQDYGYNRDSFTPQAELKITSQETQVFGADNNILPPGAGNLVRPEDVRQVQITKSSVRTEADHSMQEHLEQVYQPKPEDLVQYSEEEDRMPTILFDDDMARQIEQERTMWESKQTQDKLQKGEDDAPSVKMSK